MNDAELDSMLSEIGGPCNFENMLRCFEGKMSGMCNDPDEMIINGILCHDEEGKYFARLSLCLALLSCVIINAWKV